MSPLRRPKAALPQPTVALAASHSPIVNHVGLGYVVKSPRIYPGYENTTLRPELNASGAEGYVKQGTLILDGFVAGPITAQPTSDSGSEFYTFLIDRGLTTAPGPIPGRPRILFDAAVTVSITPAGTTGEVEDLATGTVTPLDPSQIFLGLDKVQVFLPPSEQGGTTGKLPRVTFAPSDTSFDTAVASNFESFAPEFSGFVISPHPIPHHTGT